MVFKNAAILSLLITTPLIHCYASTRNPSTKSPTVLLGKVFMRPLTIADRNVYNQDENLTVDKVLLYKVPANDPRVSSTQEILSPVYCKEGYSGLECIKADLKLFHALANNGFLKFKGNRLIPGLLFPRLFHILTGHWRDKIFFYLNEQKDELIITSNPVLPKKYSIVNFSDLTNSALGYWQFLLLFIFSIAPLGLCYSLNKVLPPRTLKSVVLSFAGILTAAYYLVLCPGIASAIANMDQGWYPKFVIKTAWRKSLNKNRMAFTVDREDHGEPNFLLSKLTALLKTKEL